MHQIASLGGLLPNEYVSEPALIAFFALAMLSCCHNVLLNGRYYNEFEKAEKMNLTIEDIIPKLKTLKNSLPEVAEGDEEYHKKNTVIAVNGYWYNVKHFMKSHPGGPIIEHYVGADVTTSFYGMHRHPDEILKKWTPVAKLKLDKDGLRNEKVNNAYFKLWHRYKELGIFDPSQSWYAKVSICNMIYLAITVYLITNYPEDWFFSGMLLGLTFS